MPARRCDRFVWPSRSESTASSEIERSAVTGLGPRQCTPTEPTDGRSRSPMAKGRKTGQVLVCDGHVDMHTFYELANNQSIGHDHLIPGNSCLRRNADRGKHSE